MCASLFWASQLPATCTVSLWCPTTVSGVSLCFYSPAIHIIPITVRHISPCATPISPSSNRKILIWSVRRLFSVFASVLIWPYWKGISIDVHSLNKNADHLPPWPQLTNNKPTVTRILYFHLLRDVKNITLWKKNWFTSPKSVRSLLSVIWKQTLIKLSDGSLSQKENTALRQQLDHCPWRCSCWIPLLTYSSSAIVPMPFPHMVCHWHKGCFVSVLFQKWVTSSE